MLEGQKLEQKRGRKPLMATTNSFHVNTCFRMPIMTLLPALRSPMLLWPVFLRFCLTFSMESLSYCGRLLMIRDSSVWDLFPLP